MLGKAVDIRLTGVNTREVRNLAVHCSKAGLGTISGLFRTSRYRTGSVVAGRYGL